MHIERRISVAILITMTAAVCSAQSITSARSGTLHYFEGDVSIDGVQLQSKTSKFPQVKEQGVLRTGQGRAEVLLTPGVFLRAGENTAIRMLDARLASTRVEILAGTVMVESDDPQMSVKDSPVSLIYKDYEVRMVKHGLFEITSEPSQMKVFKGEAEVVTADNRAVVKEGRLLPFTAALASEKFDAKTGDELYLWTRDRSENLSAANMSSARSLSTVSGSGFGAGGNSPWNGGWYFNPYFDMFTFVPAGGTLWSPFGYGFFSPASIYSYYAPTGYWAGGAGARSTGLIGQPVGTAGSAARLVSPMAQMRGAANSEAPLSTGLRGGPGIASGPSMGGSPSAGVATMGSSSRGGFSGGGAASGAAAGGMHSGGGIRGR